MISCLISFSYGFEMCPPFSRQAHWGRSSVLLDWTPFRPEFESTQIVRHHFWTTSVITTNIILLAVVEKRIRNCPSYFFFLQSLLKMLNRRQNGGLSFTTTHRKPRCMVYDMWRFQPNTSFDGGSWNNIISFTTFLVIKFKVTMKGKAEKDHKTVFLFLCCYRQV